VVAAPVSAEGAGIAFCRFFLGGSESRIRVDSVGGVSCSVLGGSMMKQIFGRRKVSKTADKESVGGRRHAVLNQQSGSGVADLSGQQQVLSGTGHAYGSGNRVGFQESRINDAFFSSYFRPLPSIKDVPNTEKQNLLIVKLNMCCTLFDFSDPTKNIKEKKIKVETLMEILDYVKTANTKFPEIVVEGITKMISANLFRTLVIPPREKKVLQAFDLEEDEPLMDPAWPHLHIVYELLLNFVQSAETDAKLAKRYVDHSFILRMLELFDSEDHREREYLKMLVHRIYGKFMVYRPFIRKAINNVFYQFIYETEKHNGIAELLEILGSIINGFALPLKEEHKLFLVRTLIPLHKARCISMYHRQLSYCITQFVEKDGKLADTIIRGIIKYWPVTNSPKEVLFLGELEEILEATQPSEFQKCMVPVFCQVARCFNSSHFQVNIIHLILDDYSLYADLLPVSPMVELLACCVLLPHQNWIRCHLKQSSYFAWLNVSSMLVCYNSSTSFSPTIQITNFSWFIYLFAIYFLTFKMRLLVCAVHIINLISVCLFGIYFLKR